MRIHGRAGCFVAQPGTRILCSAAAGARTAALACGSVVLFKYKSEHILLDAEERNGAAVAHMWGRRGSIVKVVPVCRLGAMPYEVLTPQRAA